LTESSILENHIRNMNNLTISDTKDTQLNKDSIISNKFNTFDEYDNNDDNDFGEFDKEYKFSDNINIDHLDEDMLLKNMIEENDRFGETLDIFTNTKDFGYKTDFLTLYKCLAQSISQQIAKNNENFVKI